MIPLQVLQAALPQGQWQGAPPPALGDASIDARRIGEQGLFVALPGRNADGHSFLAQARENGAAAALVTRYIEDPLPQYRVADAQAALQDLATAWRAQWHGTLLALTGSNGKTTVKEMLAAILEGVAPACVTRGNYNNHLGVPLTLTRLRHQHRYAVIEMGANHAGEIASYVRWARPDVGLITLAAAAHLEGFGSIEGVAHAKGELFTALGAADCAVINAEDRYATLWQQMAAPARQLLFGAGGDVEAAEVEAGAEGSRFTLCLDGQRRPLTLGVAGPHNVHNALAAAAGAHALGVDIEAIVDGLQRFRPVSGRLAAQTLPGGLRLIDDSYNANPGSVAAAIGVLAAQPGPRLLCLGDMAELGGEVEAHHAAVGRQAQAAGIEALWSCGTHARAASAAFGPNGRHYDSLAELNAALRAQAAGFGAILVKGSRSAGMDAAVAALQQDTPDA